MKKKYSITNMNGYTENDSSQFSYENQNGEVGVKASYSLTDMNSCSGEDDVQFAFVSMNEKIGEG